MLTTNDIATHYGQSTRRILQIAESRGIKPAMIVQRAKLWHKRDLPKFAAREPGWPGQTRNVKRRRKA